MKTLRTTTRQIRILSFVAILAVAVCQSAAAVELAEVKVQSGRTFEGNVAKQTTDKTLWLRFGSAHAEILRPIAWEKVVSVTYNDRQYTPDAFRELVATFKPDDFEVMPTPALKPTSHEPTFAEQAQIALSESPLPPRSVDVTAYAANWDADTEVDGLEVHVYPRDEFGEVVPVTGSVEIILNTELSRPREMIISGQWRVRNQRIGRWSRHVQPADFGLSGAVYRVPFRALHPEFDPRVINLSLVHIRLIVPGHGVFEASTTSTRIRPLSQVRSRREMQFGDRFYPIERTGRGQRD